MSKESLLVQSRGFISDGNDQHDGDQKDKSPFTVDQDPHVSLLL
jgi:hypothetical protein